MHAIQKSGPLKYANMWHRNAYLCSQRNCVHSRSACLDPSHVCTCLQVLAIGGTLLWQNMLTLHVLHNLGPSSLLKPNTDEIAHVYNDTKIQTKHDVVSFTCLHVDPYKFTYTPNSRCHVSQHDHRAPEILQEVRNPQESCTCCPSSLHALKRSLASCCGQIR